VEPYDAKRRVNKEQSRVSRARKRTGEGRGGKVGAKLIHGREKPRVHVMTILPVVSYRKSLQSLHFAPRRLVLYTNNRARPDRQIDTCTIPNSTIPERLRPISSPSPHLYSSSPLSSTRVSCTRFLKHNGSYIICISGRIRRQCQFITRRWSVRVVCYDAFYVY
jgi:hypothetical protein